MKEALSSKLRARTFRRSRNSSEDMLRRHPIAPAARFIQSQIGGAPEAIR
jgi:hypothetical protein